MDVDPPESGSTYFQHHMFPNLAKHYEKIPPSPRPNGGHTPRVDIYEFSGKGSTPIFRDIIPDSELLIALRTSTNADSRVIIVEDLSRELINASGGRIPAESRVFC